MLNNCKKFGVVPKFLYFNLPFTNHIDAKAIRKMLLECDKKKNKRKKEVRKRS